MEYLNLSTENGNDTYYFIKLTPFTKFPLCLVFGLLRGGGLDIMQHAKNAHDPPLFPFFVKLCISLFVILIHFMKQNASSRRNLGHCVPKFSIFCYFWPVAPLFSAKQSKMKKWPKISLWSIFAYNFQVSRFTLHLNSEFYWRDF